MPTLLSSAGARAVAESLRALYLGSGFAFIVLEEPLRIRVRYADPDKTAWQEVATIAVDPKDTGTFLQARVVHHVESTRERWKTEAHKRYWKMVRRGLVWDPQPPPPGSL